MDVAAVSSTIGVVNQPLAPRDRTAAITAEDVQKVAKQFEAIITRQLLKPAIDPIMNGGSTGEGGATGGGGGGIYGYLLTDVLATQLSQGSGTGLSDMIARQLTPDALKQAYAGATMPMTATQDTSATFSHE